MMWDVEGQAKIKFQPRHDQHTGQGQQEPGNRYRKTQDAIDKQYYNDSDMEDEMTNSRTVLNLSGPRCGTVTRMMKTPGKTKWTTVEGTRSGLCWPARETLITASEKVDQEGDRQK